MRESTVALTTELIDSYISYSASAYHRALPDLRDGLRPASRRVVFGAHISNTRGYTKCAKLDGTVTGTLSPHGSAYGTIVNLSQQATQQLPVLNFQGNSGGYSPTAYLSEDSPAAARYTETKLDSEVAPMLLADLDSVMTLHGVPNYDGTIQEPSVLAPSLPYLLTQTVTGIGVGYAANWRPFNLVELLQATINQLSNVADATSTLYPDWTTGGVVEPTEGTLAALRSGRGTVIVRGVAELERHKGSKAQIVITELPPGVSAEALSEQLGRVAEDAAAAKLKYIGVSDESSREGVRIVVLPARRTDPELLLKWLFRKTALRSSISLNQTALAESGAIPRVYTVAEAISGWHEHRLRVIRQRLSAETQRLHSEIDVLSAIIAFLNRLDEFDLHNLDLSILEPLSESARSAIQSLTVRQLSRGQEYQYQLELAQKELESVSSSEPHQIILEELKSTLDWAISSGRFSRRTRIAAQ